MAEEIERMLRIEEAREALAIGRSKMFELLAEGEIKSVLVGTSGSGRSRRIPLSEFNRYVASLQQSA